MRIVSSIKNLIKTDYVGVWHTTFLGRCKSSWLTLDLIFPRSLLVPVKASVDRQVCNKGTLEAGAANLIRWLTPALNLKEKKSKCHEVYFLPCQYFFLLNVFPLQFSTWLLYFALLCGTKGTEAMGNNFKKIRNEEICIFMKF